MEQLTPLLEKLANKLGTTTEHLWKVLLQQVNVEMVLRQLWMSIWLWGGIGLIALAIIMIIMIIKYDGEEIIALPFLIIVVAIVSGSIGYYINYSKLLTLQNNPEYWALHEVLSVIK